MKRWWMSSPVIVWPWCLELTHQHTIVSCRHQLPIYVSGLTAHPLLLKTLSSHIYCSYCAHQDYKLPVVKITNFFDNLCQQLALLYRTFFFRKPYRPAFSYWKRLWIIEVLFSSICIFLHFLFFLLFPLLFSFNFFYFPLFSNVVDPDPFGSEIICMFEYVHYQLLNIGYRTDSK